MSSPEPPAVAPADRPAPRAPARFTRLLPGGEPTTAGELVDAIDLPALGPPLARRPYVVLNMVATVDGRATIDGLSGTVSNRADRELFHALRGAVDAVLVAGADFTEPLALELLSVLENESCVFLRYAVRADAPAADRLP